jgi:hypothetical protein
MKKVFAAKYLSAALAVAAFAAASSVPAFAQSYERTGSALPHYWDDEGDLIWDSWGSATADQQERGAGSPSRNQQAGPPSRNQQAGPPSRNQQAGPPSRNQQAGLPLRNRQAGLPSRHLYLDARSRSSHARNS